MLEGQRWVPNIDPLPEDIDPFPDGKTLKLWPKSYREFVLNLELEIATCYFTPPHFFIFLYMLYLNIRS